MNTLMRQRGTRFGPVDLSKNVSPSRTEKLLNRSFLVVALMAGIITATVSMQRMAHMESKILLAGIVLSGFRIRPVQG